MELENDRGDQILPPTTSGQKVRSSNRMRYEVEAQFLRQQNGDLEQIRGRLGLSKRKICQLLLVDPSAWTRWTQAGGSAPPHIYKALDWYLSILEKDPEYRRLSQRFAQWLNNEKDHAGRLANLEARIIDQKAGVLRLQYGPQIAAAFLAGALITGAVFKLL